MKPDPLLVIKKLIKERFSSAVAVFWTGSVSCNQGTPLSDLDLIVLYEKVPQAYRQAFIYDGWPVDAFFHDLQTLEYFFKEIDAKSGIPAMPMMIVTSVLMTPASRFSVEAIQLAQKTIADGPPAWDQQTLDRARFLITDALDDVMSPSNRMEQISIVSDLYGKLADFYFRANKKWSASGKSLARYLEKDDPELAKMFFISFEQVFQEEKTSLLESLVQKILAPFGGLFWNGYEAKAQATMRVYHVEHVINGMTLTYEAQAAQHDLQKLNEGISEYASVQKQQKPIETFAFFIRSEQGEMMGGCHGAMYYGCLYIDELWVDERIRHQGWGRKLIFASEQLGLEKDCLFSTVNTMDWEAREFYQKLGYQIEFERSGYRNDSTLYFLKKTFA